MPCMQRSFKFIVLALFALCAGCITWAAPQPMTQAEVAALETRFVDAPLAKVYDAAVEALFDLGYTVTHSDKSSGLVVGERQKEKVWTVFENGMWQTRQGFESFQITLLIQPETKKQTKVRIKTAINKEQRMNKRAIDDVWIFIERQVLMGAK